MPLTEATDGSFVGIRELDAGVGAGFLEAALGVNILRAETAVCAALAAAQYAFGAFRHKDGVGASRGGGGEGNL